jgi:hypothetical protein
MDALKSLMQPLSNSAVGSGVLDATKLVILGGTVETARAYAFLSAVSNCMLTGFSPGFPIFPFPISHLQDESLPLAGARLSTLSS